jgi:beta-xylosidase
MKTLVGAGDFVWASGNHEGRGNADCANGWDDATWHFASPEPRDRFISDPEAYAPAYGGYCAWAIAEGKVAGIDPEMWHIEDGRLYLNYSARINRRFLEDVNGNIDRAETNWPRIRSELEARR